jgi:putative DNA primase/helicase
VAVGEGGGISVVVSGARRGLCNDFRTGDKATDILGFIRSHQCGGDWKRTLDWARSFLGVAPGERPQPIRQLRRDKAVDNRAEAEKIKRAQGFWREAVPVEGTLAERYLNAARGIPTPPGGWPECVHFHPGRRALILAATRADGTVQAVQLVHLTEQAEKRPDEPGRPTKQSFGPQAGAAVRLPGFCTDGMAPGALQTAEGPETGLSLWASTGRETWVALGQVSKMDLPRKRRVILCADDDPKNAQSAQSMRKTYTRWISDGFNVVAAFPWNPRRFDKSDFNDLLQRHGIYSVRARILDAIQPKGPAPSRRQVVELGEGGRLLREAMVSARDAAIGYDPKIPGALPPVQGIRITVGGGKSHSARVDYALAMLTRLRADGDRRNVAMAVPTHKLADEQAKAMAAEFNAHPLAGTLRLTARVWRGRTADDPRQPGKKMCQDLEAVQDAHHGGVLDIQTKVCCNSKTGQACHLAPLCDYQLQRQQHADLWIFPHQMLFTKLPATIGKLAALIVDEAIWQHGLDGVTGHPISMTVDSLRAAPLLPDDLNGLDSARLRECYRLVSAALETHPAGPLSRAHFLACGVTEDTARDGHRLSWRCAVEPDIQPGMPAEARKALIADAGENRHATQMARIFRSLQALLAADGPEFSGWLALGTSTRNDGTVRMLQRKGRKDVAAGWRVPTIILDALLDPDLLRPYWPQIQVVADIEIEAPHQHVYQVIDQTFAKTRLVPSKATVAEAEMRRQGLAKPSKRTVENDRRNRNAADVLAVLRREARQHRPNRILAVAQMAVEINCRAAGNLPANLDLAHHNAVAGRDEWKNVACLAVVGRTQPAAAAVEEIAEALTGKAMAERLTQYQKVQRALVMADGSQVAVEADCHSDPLAEAVRWQICEGELIQIIGRGRGVRRTAESPLTVLVMTSVPLPVSLAGVMTWAEMAPTFEDTMLSLEGVALEAAADAFACFPHLCRTANATKQAFKRQRLGTFPIKKIIYGESTQPLLSATYQKVGAGQRAARLTFDPEVMPVADLQAWLEDNLGALAWLKIEGMPDHPLAEAVFSRVEVSSRRWRCDVSMHPYGDAAPL